MDKDTFFKFFKNIIPDTKIYDDIVKHTQNKNKKTTPNIINKDKYNTLCEKNEKEYLDNFLACIFK